jgi:hypothetical protein
MRFGIIGAGRHGARYLRHLQQGDVPGARASVIWRQTVPAAQATAAEHGMRAVADWRQLVDAADVDAVIVATPPGAHAEAITAAVALGKPVLTEKPVCATLAEALALDAALPADAPVMVAQTLRFNVALVAARRDRLRGAACRWDRDVADGGCLLPQRCGGDDRADQDKSATDGRGRGGCGERSEPQSLMLIISSTRLRACPGTQSVRHCSHAGQTGQVSAVGRISEAHPPSART